MLEEVLRFINNRFERDYTHGLFTVANGGMELPDALEGQYFWVEGSVLNDGLHLYPANDMRDETFEGSVWLLAVPETVVELAAEIQTWSETHKAVVDSGFQSESFGGYSYTKPSGGTQGSELQPASWQQQFGSRLRPFRKLSRDWV